MQKPEPNNNYMQVQQTKFPKITHIFDLFNKTIVDIEQESFNKPSVGFNNIIHTQIILIIIELLKFHIIITYFSLVSAMIEQLLPSWKTRVQTPVGPKDF